MPYVIIGETFSSNNFKAVEMDKFRGFFITDITQIIAFLVLSCTCAVKDLALEDIVIPKYVNLGTNSMDSPAKYSLSVAAMRPPRRNFIHFVLGTLIARLILFALSENAFAAVSNACRSREYSTASSAYIRILTSLKFSLTMLIRSAETSMKSNGLKESPWGRP